MNNQTDFESRIRERLDELKQVPARNPQVAARARARFLAQAISASESQRHKSWGFVFRKQQFAMNLVVTVLVIASLLIGGGTTVKAAQDDLPNEPLYPIKTLSEDISLQFQSSPEAKVDRLLELAQTRIQEMSRLIEAGQTPPERVSLRLEQHLQQTLQLCSNMEDAALDQKLLQLRGQLRQYERDLQGLQPHAAQSAQPILEQTRTMLQTQLYVVEDGLLNHELFRNTVHNGFHYGQTRTPTAVASRTSTPSGAQGDQATPHPDGPGNGNGLGPNANPGGPNAHMTPTPHNNGSNSGTNAGGNDKDKNPKGTKDKGNDNNNGNGNKPEDKKPK